MQDFSLNPSPGGVEAHEPLLQDPNPPANPQSEAEVTLVGEAQVIGPSWAHAPILGTVFFGTQIIWSIEMAYGGSGPTMLQNFGHVTNCKLEASSYLHSLGLSKAAASMILLAAPLSGLVVQPLVGAFADRMKSRYGRRRPFMLIGSLTCAISMLVLSWAQALSSFFGGVSSDVRSDFLVVTMFHRVKEGRFSLLPYHSILLILP